MAGRSKSDHVQPVNVQGSSSGGVARRRDSDYRFVKSKAKRVRFADVNGDPLSNSTANDSSTGYEATREPGSGIPKTSEYAFFKKVKEAAIQCNQHSVNKGSKQKLKDVRHCYPNILHKDKEKLKKFKTNDYIGKALSKSNMLNCHIGDIKLSVQSEKASLNNQCPFVSPVKGRCKSPGEACPVGPEDWPFSHPKNVTTLDQNLQLSPQTAAKYSDSQCWESEVFSSKRHKLRRWAEMALSGTENFSSKGNDMVTVLLSRLSPDSNENKGSKLKGNTGCSPVFAESDPPEMRHHQSFSRDLTEPEYETCQSSELSSWLIGTRELIPVDFPSFATDNCFTKYNANTVSHNEIVNNSHASKRETTKRLLKQIDSPVHLRFGRSRVTECYHLLEPDSVYSRNESPKREPQTLLLDWDFEKEKYEPVIAKNADWCEDKMDSQIVTLWDTDVHESIDTGHNTMALCSRREPQTLLLDWDFDRRNDEPEMAINADWCEDKMDSQIVTLWDADLHKSIYTGHNKRASSLIPYHSPHFCILPDFHSTSLQEELYTRDFERNLEYEEYALAEPDCSSSLYNEEYLDPEEYGDSSNAYECGNAISYFLDYPRGGPVRVFSEKRNLNSDAFLLPMALNSSEWNNLLTTGFPMPNHSSQHSYRSACTIQSEKAWNLGSSNSTIVGFEGEAFDSLEQPTYNFQTSCDRMLGCPLLLKDSSCAISEEETYPGSSNE